MRNKHGMLAIQILAVEVTSAYTTSPPLNHTRYKQSHGTSSIMPFALTMHWSTSIVASMSAKSS